MEKFTEEKIEINNNNEYKWYVIQTYNVNARPGLAQDDRKKAEKLLDIFKKNNNSHLLKEIFLAIEEKKNPYTNEIEYKNIASGYIFINMLWNNETKVLLTKHQKDVGIIMSRNNQIVIIPESQITNMKKIIEEKNNEKAEFVIGDMVKIINRDFTDFQGIVTDILPDGYLNITITIFGRNTIVKCSVKDVEKID